MEFSYDPFCQQAVELADSWEGRGRATLGVANIFNCHCSLLDEHLSATYRGTLYEHSAKNIAIIMLVFLCIACELFISLLTWLS